MWKLKNILTFLLKYRVLFKLIWKLWIPYYWLSLSETWHISDALSPHVKPNPLVRLYKSSRLHKSWSRAKSLGDQLIYITWLRLNRNNPSNRLLQEEEEGKGERWQNRKLDPNFMQPHLRFTFYRMKIPSLKLYISQIFVCIHIISGLP
jgi:hypothetical protein